MAILGIFKIEKVIFRVALVLFRVFFQIPLLFTVSPGFVYLYLERLIPSKLFENHPNLFEFCQCFSSYSTNFNEIDFFFFFQNKGRLSWSQIQPNSSHFFSTPPISTVFFGSNLEDSFIGQGFFYLSLGR